MYKELKLKSSFSLIAGRVLLVLLSVAIISFMFLGLVDIRSEEDKQADAKNQLMAETSFKCGVEALQYAYASKNYDIQKVKSVAYLGEAGIWLLITYYDSGNMECKISYDYNRGKGYSDGTMYSEKLGMALAQNSFLGKTNNDCQTIYEGDNLKIMIEEANLWG